MGKRMQAASSVVQRCTVAEMRRHMGAPSTHIVVTVLRFLMAVTGKYVAVVSGLSHGRCFAAGGADATIESLPWPPAKVRRI